MTISIRPMAESEADAVAGMVRGLADHIGTGVVPRLTGEKLVASLDLIDVLVAEEDGRLLGACLGLLTFSTWRGEKGLYVVDLFVEPAARGKAIGEKLLRVAAQRGAMRGVRFIKLEVDETNTGAQRFYERIGFIKKTEDRLHILEPDHFNTFIEMGDRT